MRKQKLQLNNAGISLLIHKGRCCLKTNPEIFTRIPDKGLGTDKRQIKAAEVRPCWNLSKFFLPLFPDLLAVLLCKKCL